MGRTGKAVSVKVSVHQLNPSHTFIEMDFIPSQLQGSLNGQAAKKSQCNQARIGVGLYFQPLENILTLRLGQIAFLLALSRLRFRRKLLRCGAFKGIVPFAIMPLQTISPKLIQRIFALSEMFSVVTNLLISRFVNRDMGLFSIRLKNLKMVLRMVDGKDTAAKTKPFISKENSLNRPETIQQETVLGVSAFREQIGSEKEVSVMPRMPKYLKLSE